MSRPVWGAWIEMFENPFLSFNTVSRAPYGARGLKFDKQFLFFELPLSRAPYGARGLK